MMLQPTFLHHNRINLIYRASPAGATTTVAATTLAATWNGSLYYVLRQRWQRWQVTKASNTTGEMAVNTTADATATEAVTMLAATTAAITTGGTAANTTAGATTTAAATTLAATTAANTTGGTAALSKPTQQQRLDLR